MIHDYAGHPSPVDLSRELARRGHIVWHAYFVGDKGPKGMMTRAEHDPEGFEFLPIDIGRNYSKSNFISRRNNDILYGKTLAKHIGALGPEIVISGNTPLDAQGLILAATHKAGGRFVNWIQDFYSIAIERLISTKWLGLGAAIAGYYRWMDKRQLAQSDATVLISEDFRKNLTGFERRPERVAVIPNWGAIDGLPLCPKTNPWSISQGLADRFVFLYSGTLGLKHNPDALLALADAFSDRPDVVVVVAASGVGSERLEATLATMPRPNLVTLPLQPFTHFASMLGAADVLVAVLEEDAGEFSVPSKILSYLCAGRPIILAAPPENLASRTIRNIPAGHTVSSDDTQGLISAAARLLNDESMRRDLGSAARAYAETHFSIASVADRFEEVLAQI